MTRMVLALVIALIAGFSLPPALSADVLLIKNVRQAESMDVPANGMTRGEVRARFGEPVKVHSSVGYPPITQWEFDGWSVYFEYDLVLYTVLHKDTVTGKKTE